MKQTVSTHYWALIIAILGLIIMSGFICNDTYGQYQSPGRTWVGLSLGRSHYGGDITDAENHYAFSAQVSHALSERFCLRGKFTITQLGATDKVYRNDVGNIFNRPFPFKSDVQEVAILPEWNFRSLEEYYRFTPYVFAGLGLVHYSAHNDGNDYGSGTTLSIPVGAGIKYAIRDDAHLFLEGSLHNTLSDKVDGYQWTYHKANDYWYQVQVGIQLRLSRGDR